MATEANLRLRCRSHNALAAERTYGAGFMQEKREAARQARLAAEETDSCAAPAALPNLPAGASQAGVCAHAKELFAGLHELGFRAAEARRAVEHCASIAEGTLEEHMRAALRYLAPRPRVAH
jgi:Holliday junction resolvasome RuvABC DNA-binding subunit